MSDQKELSSVQSEIEEPSSLDNENGSDSTLSETEKLLEDEPETKKSPVEIVEEKEEKESSIFSSDALNAVGESVYQSRVKYGAAFGSGAAGGFAATGSVLAGLAGGTLTTLIPGAYSVAHGLNEMIVDDLESKLMDWRDYRSDASELIENAEEVSIEGTEIEYSNEDVRELYGIELDSISRLAESEKDEPVGTINLEEKDDLYEFNLSLIGLGEERMKVKGRIGDPDEYIELSSPVTEYEEGLKVKVE